MKRLWLMGFVVGLFAMALAGCGITAPRSNEGYADLDSLGFRDVDNTMTLSIGPTLLRFAATHGEDDRETRALLAGLEGVRVRTYDIDGDAERVADRINRMSDRLQDQAWHPVALIRDEDQTVHMLLKGSEAGIVGLMVLVSDGKEAVVVNVMGDLRPELFSETMVALNVDVTPEIRIAATEPAVLPAL